MLMKKDYVLFRVKKEILLPKSGDSPYHSPEHYHVIGLIKSQSDLKKMLIPLFKDIKEEWKKELKSTEIILKTPDELISYRISDIENLSKKEKDAIREDAQDSKNSNAVEAKKIMDAIIIE